MMAIISHKRFLLNLTHVPFRNIHNNDSSCDDFGLYHKPIGLEFKCPYPSPFKLPVHYDVPKDYVPQCILQMKSEPMDKLWYGTYCKLSTCLIEMDLNSEFDVIEEVGSMISMQFDKQRPTKPTHIGALQRQYHPKLKQYAELNSTVIGEVPSLTAEEGQLELLSEFYPYHIPAPINTYIAPQYSDELTEQLLLEQSNTIFKEHYQLRRIEATEILAFVVNSAEPTADDHNLGNIPIAYGLKSPKMKIECMRNMLTDVFKACKEKDIHLLATVFDGQFYKLIVRLKENKPLTKYQLMKDLWKDITSWDKNKCLNFLTWFCKIANDDEDAIAHGSKLPAGKEYIQGNCSIKWKRNTNGKKVLSIGTNGRNSHNLFLSDIKTPTNPEAWIHEKNTAKKQSKKQVPIRNLTSKDIDKLLEGSKYGRKRRAKASQAELLSYDSDSDEYKSEDDPDFDINDMQMSFDSEESDEDTTEDDLLNESTFAVPTTEVGGDFLRCCLAELQKFNNNHKWTSKDTSDLYDDFLATMPKIWKLYRYELDAMMEVIHEFTGIKIFNKSDVKAIKVKQLWRNLGNNMDSLTNVSLNTTIVTSTTVPSLSLLCRTKILHDNYPVQALRVSTANCKLKASLIQWKESSTVPAVLNIPGTDFSHDIYWYPEQNEDVGQLQNFTFDPTHIISNVRNHLSKKPYAGLSTEAWKEVSQVAHEILPKCYITEQLDRQSAAIAQQFFCEDVQNKMEELGFDKEAEFCEKIHKFYASVDERGISYKDRLRDMQDLADYLSDRFPLQFPLPMKHIGNIPVTTYEAIMQTISCRFILYHIKGSAYSQRYVSTLGIESFFSDLTRNQFYGLGQPKAVALPRMVSRIVAINSIKHNSQRYIIIYNNLQIYIAK